MINRTGQMKALRRLDVIHAGEQTFPLEKNIRAVAITRLLDDLKPLR